jgi:hypothetical protein
MRFSLASPVLMIFAIVLASGCQSPPPPVAQPAPEIINPTVACERSCSIGDDACLDGPASSVGGVKAGGRSDPVTANLGEACSDQLKACLRRCLN